MSEIQSLSFQDLNKKEKLKEKPKIASEKKNVSRKRQPPTESHKNELENQTGKAQKEEALDIKREVVYESYGALSKPLASTTPMTKATSEEGSHSKEEVQTKRLEHDSSTSENMKSYPSGGEKVWTGEPEATGSFYAPDFGSYTKGGSIQDGGAGLESVSLAGNRSNPSEFGGIGQSVEEKEETASAKLVDFSKPDYPAYSRERGEEGTVTLAIEVYPNGAHGKIEIVRSSGYSRLDQAAIRAIEKASFLPAKVNGKPVSSVKQIVIRFQLEEAEN
jgi:TonB family protein